LEHEFELILCHGETPSHDLATRARARLASNLYICYEPAETSTVTYAQSPIVSEVTHGQGLVCPGATVDTLDADGTPMPIGREGTIRIRTPGMCSGYVGDPEASKQIFRSGGFCPGDVGYTTSDGLLVVTSRKQSTPDAVRQNDAG
jgi:long-subunit acyl-CoA synthetase (AMP-forming)